MKSCPHNYHHEVSIKSLKGLLFSEHMIYDLPKGKIVLSAISIELKYNRSEVIYETHVVLKVRWVIHKVKKTMYPPY